MTTYQRAMLWLRGAPLAGAILVAVFALGGWCWSVTFRLGELEKKMDTLLKANGVKVAEKR